MVKRKVLFIALLVISLFIFRFFYNFSQYWITSSNLYEGESECKSSSYDIRYGEYSFHQPKFEVYFKTGINSSEGVNIIQFFDLKYPIRFLIFNPGGKEYTFVAPFVNVKLEAGITHINVFNSGSVEIINPDDSVEVKNYSVSDIIEHSFYDLVFTFNEKKPKKTMFTEAMKRKEDIFISERFKLLSFFIYIPGIILLILYQKGFKVKLACLYFAILIALHGHFTVESSMVFQLQTMSGHPKMFIFASLTFLIYLYLLRLIYLGFKEIKKLSFYDVGITISYLVLPWIIYF